MGDWADESPSDEEDVNEIENELYSMFYYHSMSDGIPEDLSKKYNVDVNDFGVTISLKDTPCASHQSGSDHLNNEVESENIEIYNNRYIDGRKGDCIPKKQVVSVDKSSPGNNINKDLPEKLPICSPNPPITPKNSKFQSSRYFFQGDPNTYSYKDNFKYRNSNYYSTHLFKKQSNLHNNGFSKEVYHDSIFSSTPVVKRKSDYLNDTPLKKLKNQTNDPIFINDDDDIIEVITPKKRKNKNKRNKSLNKNQNPVILISSESESENDDEVDLTTSDSESDFDLEYSEEKSINSILLNTSMPFDQDYCDISVINIDYDWKQTSSPEGWTPSMRKFYNKPSKKHLNFDYKDILQEIRNQGSGDWSICKADRRKFKGSRHIRCLRCQQEGHVKSQCTKILSCHMCGTPGHSSAKCPKKICLKCGSKCRDLFPSGCGNCVNGAITACSVCGIQGHYSTYCTDAWRSLRDEVLNDESKTIKGRTGTKYCCNCGKSGHYYEDCSKTIIDPSPSNSRGGSEWKDWKTFKASFKKNRGLKGRKNFHNDVHNSTMNDKREKFRLRSKNARNEKRMDLHFSNRRINNRHVSKRILMLRKTNRKNMFKACLSNTI